MDDKVYISYYTAKCFLMELIKNNDFSDDKEIISLLHSMLQDTPHLMTIHAENQSRILIDKNARIFLPDYSGEEVRMPFLAKTVFLFFLLHPEGVEFKRMHNYLQELCDIYQQVSIDKNMGMTKIRQVLDNLVEPVNNSIYEACSIIKKRLLNVVAPLQVNTYCVTGRRGGCHYIQADRNLLVIEHKKLNLMFKR